MIPSKSRFACDIMPCSIPRNFAVPILGTVASSNQTSGLHIPQDNNCCSHNREKLTFRALLSCCRTRYLFFLDFSTLIRRSLHYNMKFLELCGGQFINCCFLPRAKHPACGFGWERNSIPSVSIGLLQQSRYRVSLGSE